MTNSNTNGGNSKKAIIDEKFSNMRSEREESSYSNEFDRKPEVINLEDDVDDEYGKEDEHPVETIDYQDTKKTVPIFISRLFGGGKKH